MYIGVMMAVAIVAIVARGVVVAVVAVRGGRGVIGVIVSLAVEMTMVMAISITNGGIVINRHGMVHEAVAIHHRMMMIRMMITINTILSTTVTTMPGAKVVILIVHPAATSITGLAIPISTT